MALLVLISGAMVQQLEAARGPTAHLLGPTGMMGTNNAKEIQITKVDKGSPADGGLSVGEVIIGLAGKPFAGDPRRDLAEAINAAEASDGKLMLMVKGGREVAIQLKVYGPFSDTSPYDCAKTKALVDEVARTMIDSGDYLKERLGLSWLGLMATGDPAHLDLVKRELPKQEWANPDRELLMAVVNGEKDAGYVGWNWGYSLITLSEYYLLTGDKSVLPAIEAYAMALSLGQDPAGIWGHRMTSPFRNGRLPGYSHINQPSLSCFIGLVLARQCGLDRPELDQAIEKCRAFYSNFVGKGTIPYGVHDPNNRSYNNNGMSGSAGVAMHLLNEREGARFFSRQTANGYDTLEAGHASHFFNVLWTPLGAAVAGPEVTREFAKRSRWLYTLWRAWDGKFTYDGAEHKSLTPSGALLLNYCLPRKQLMITGREGDESCWLKGGEVQKVMDYSRIAFTKLGVDELIGMLGHEAPQVRRQVVGTLRTKEGVADAVERVIRSGNKLEKISALGFFGYQCPPELVRPRLKMIGAVIGNRDEDSEVRAEAGDAISWLGEETYGYYDDLLRLLLEDRPSDPFGLLDKQIGRSLVNLCSDPFATGLVKDKDLFYRAVIKLAGNKRQEARGYAMSLLNGMPKEDFGRVADVVKHVTLNRDRSYHSYHNPQATLLPAGLLLAKQGVKEGPEWAYQVMNTQDGKNSFKVRATVGVLKAYGVRAKEIVGLIEQDENLMKAMSGGRFSKDWQELIKLIDQGQGPAADEVSFEEARQGG